MKRLLFTVMLLALLPLGLAQDELEIFSWWAGDEGPALEALIDMYEEQNPGVEVINATVTGGAGVNARAVLKTRMLGGDPPDSFQVHAGQELIGTYVVADRMEDLTSLFEEQGWMDVYPESVLDTISTEEGIWSVPINIHRSNVLWYVPSNLDEWGVSVPGDWQEFVDETCPALRDQGVTPLVVAEPWTQQHLWESVALAQLGPADWNRLWTGELPLDDPSVMEVWETYSDVLDCTNDDAAGLSWQQASDRVAQGEAAFNVMGDWAAGYFTTTLELTPEEDFAWAASPGTEGEFMWLSDSFGHPVGAPNPENTRAWLELVGSREGQDVFNPLKGSISPRLDSDLSQYNVYGQSAAQDYQSNETVGSLAHGTVANEAFMSEFLTVIDSFAGSRNVEAAARASQQLAVDTGVGD